MADPWAAFSDPIDLAPQPPQQAMGTGGVANSTATPPVAEEATAPTPEAGADPFAGFSDPNPGGMVDPQMLGGFADELPEQASTQMSDEDKASLLHILTTFPTATAASAARQFAAAKGFAGPDTFDDVIRARDDGYGVTNDVVVDLPKLPDQGATGSFGRGLADVPTFGILDELGAVIDTLGGTDGRENVWNSEKSVMDLVNRNIDINRGIIQADEEYHPVARIAGQLLGGLPIPAGTQGVALRAGTMALREGRTMQEARAIASRAVTSRLTATGGGTGALYGFGSGEGNPLERLPNAALGGTIGATTGLALGKVAEAVAPRTAARAVAARGEPIPDQVAFRQAAERQEIDFLPADVPGATKTRMATGMTGVTLGGIPLAEAAQKTIATAKAARDRIATRLGTVSDETGAGQAAQRGAKKWIAQTEHKGGALFEAIPVDPQRRSVLINTRAALADMTGGLESNRELSALVAENPRLRAFLNAVTVKTEPIMSGSPGGTKVKQIGTAIEGGELSWQDLKRFRSIIGQIAGRPSLSDDGDQIAAMKKLYGALSEDMRATATAAGPDALKAFNRANDYWRARQTRIDGVLKDVLGADFTKGEQPAFEAINRLAKKTGGNANKLAVTLRSMPREEADSVRATIFSRMGQASAGKQDHSGDLFSPAQFVTEWSKLSDRAKAVLFTGEHRKAIDDVVRVAAGMKASDQFANVSKTGIAANALGLTGSLAGGIAGGSVLTVAGVMGVAASQFSAGKLLSSVKFAKWLAAAPKKPNSPAQLAHINRLSAVAKSEPAIANDVLNLQQRLASMFTDSPTKLAADEGLDPSTGVVRQQQPQDAGNQEQPQ